MFDGMRAGMVAVMLRTNLAEKMTMNLFSSLATLSLGTTLMTQVALAAPDAATDPRIDPQVRSFLAKINKDSSPFWELPPAKAAGNSHWTAVADDRRHVWHHDQRTDDYPGWPHSEALCCEA